MKNSIPLKIIFRHRKRKQTQKRKKQKQKKQQTKQQKQTMTIQNTIVPLILKDIFQSISLYEMV